MADIVQKSVLVDTTKDKTESGQFGSVSYKRKFEEQRRLLNHYMKDKTRLTSAECSENSGEEYDDPGNINKGNNQTENNQSMTDSQQETLMISQTRSHLCFKNCINENETAGSTFMRYILEIKN